MSDPSPPLPQDSSIPTVQPTVWAVGDWRADPSDLTLSSDGREPQRLEPKVMALLIFLAERAPDVVGRDEIFEQVWQGRAVVDGALSRAISLLRQALGDDKRQPRYIETVPRRGYRLVAPTERIPRPRPNPGSKSDSDPMLPESDSRTSVGASIKTTVEVSDPSPTGSAGRWLWLVIPMLILGLAFLGWRGSKKGEPPSAAPVAGDPIRIAVLPLDMLGAEAEDTYLSDGLTEELIHQLSGLSALGVVSRTSVTAAKAEGLTAAQIARKLRIHYLLEGSVLAAGERLRITIQLIALDQDQHLWSRTYDRAMVDVLDLHREVALDVATQVNGALTHTEQHRLASREPVDGEAYRLYLQGRQRLDRRTRKNVTRALDLLRRSVELDPNLAAAWAILGKAHLLSELYVSVPQAQAYARAQEAIDTALALDPGLAEAHVSLGLLRLFRDWDWDGAEASYRSAIQRAPSFALAHQWLSECLSLAGRHEAALESIRRAADLDPLSPLVHAAWGQRLNAAGRHREALEQLKSADALGAEFAWHLREAAYAHERLGDVQAALDAHVERMRRRGVTGADLEALQQAAAIGGLKGYWSWQYQRLSGIPTREPMLMAEALAGSGAHEQAWPWLEAAVAKRGSWFLHLVKSPALDPLRDDPRFQKLMAQARP